MLKKHDLGITPYIENISSRDRSLVRMGTSRVYVQFLQSTPNFTHERLTDFEISHHLHIRYTKHKKYTMKILPICATNVIVLTFSYKRES